MNVSRLFAALSVSEPLSVAFKKALEREIIPLTLPKNHILLEAPKISTHAYFLDSGFAMSYSFQDGRKITEDFRRAGQVIVAFKSFFEQVPSMEFIQLMTKSDVLCISHTSIQMLLDIFPEAQRIHRTLMHQCYEASRERLRDMQRLSASQQFKKLLVTFPEIELIVPQDAIASYLGITAQSLSRIKRREN